MAMTIEQQRALAMAAARARAQQLQIAAAAVAAPEDQSYGSGLIDSATKGMAFGFGDRLTALESAILGRKPGGGTFDLGNYDVPFSDRYNRALEAERSQNRKFERDNPIASKVAEIGGAVATGGGMVRAGMSPTANAAARGADWMRRGGLAAAEGGAIGSLYSLGGQEDLTNINPRDIAAGTGIGILAGPAAELVGSGINAGLRAGRNYLRPAVGARAKIAKELTPEGILALERLGPEAMVADAAPNAVRGIGYTADDAATGLRKALSERAKSAGARITRSVDDAFGPYKDTYRMTQAGRQARAAAAKPAYERAMEKSGPVDVSDVVMWLDGEIAGAKGGVKSALERARSLLVRRSTMGDMIERDLPALHQSKIALDDMLSGGSETSLGNVARGKLREVKNRLLAAMDDASPDYAAARKQFADESSVLDALQRGGDILKRNVNPSELGDEFAAMSDGAKGAFKAGAREATDEIMGEAVNAPLAAKNALKKGRNLQRISNTIGPDAAETLSRRVDAEDAFARTNAILHNSQTAINQSARDAWAGTPATGGIGGVGLEALTTTAGLPGAGTAVSVSKKLRDAVLGQLMARQRAEAAKILATSGPERKRLIEALLARRDPSLSGVFTPSMALFGNRAYDALSR